ncbi:hypothetical protein B0J18DRAFT_420535 [Chaetomium sp. MPI-SDFR-AT-0129]|uniref:ERCC4 domain-containing protein n=1 Tax=Dichotomopilus funicola TaxID=1934379 RepID=A0AAN6V5P5_9PEZI|nr:hypothetical protein B0J18DRAFT_420535 [Chaetomium sp. MPI-SDFR-AT-0129]KAK4145348.1 hypothetical protein C8A04DRAFT_35841 [Dichotomopilus funicola]
MSAAEIPQPVQPVKLSLPLIYQQKLFEELRNEDELVVLARGLGLMRLITNLLHSYDAAGNNLIVIVGAGDRENAWIGEALAEHAAISMSPRARGLTVVNTDFTSVATREKMYAAGGIFSITSRILVVDVLTDLLRPETITGMVVLHADRVTATSLEAFILRVYRQKNKAGFLKAFSDNPDPFTTGFSPLTNMMKNLFLRKASLWPRFHVHVAQALEGKKKAEVIELEVPMTDAMREIQHAVMECVEINIQELKKANTGLEMDDWNLDSALLKNFDVIVRRQLDPNWHRVSWKTKQIVGDLTVLREMLQSVLALDAVSFLQQLDTIHMAHSPPPGSTRQTQSPWLFLDAAQTIFETARRRVYSSNQKAGPNTTNIDALRPVLEEQPKWAVLAEVLEEIDRDLYFEPPARDDSNGTILIMCSDTDTCRQLRDYLQTMHVRPKTEHKVEEFHDPDADKPSAEFMMRRRLRGYLKWKREFAQVNNSLFSENHKAITGAVDPRLRGSKNRPPPNKRRRMRGGGLVGTAPGRLDNGSIAQHFEKPGEVAELMAEIQITEEESKQKEDIVADPLDDMDDYYQLYEMQDLVVIHAYNGDVDEHVLEEIKPKYIIMYEPDAAFIRRVEVYRSSHNDRNVRVYFLYYGGSVEEQRYLSSVRREKDAFTKLIKERASMSLTLTTTDTPGGADDPQEAFLRTVNTRIAGGGRLAATARPPRVVVDVREFRSSLPSLLHGRSTIIVPCMLTVGDYILTPHICVERKSISDLISSFKDGRLFAQCEAMFQHYRDPMLLIEFDQNKSFTLEPFADLSGSMSSISLANAGAQGNDLQSKIVLLTLAFPRLRIIWSSSPYETAEIFARIKDKEPEPDPIAAVRAGLDNSEDGQGGVNGQMFNPVPQEMLGTVPGVTQKNLKNLVLEVESIREVANMTVEELNPIVGREAAGKICGFFKKDLLDDD